MSKEVSKSAASLNFVEFQKSIRDVLQTLIHFRNHGLNCT
jgi:hypothetical protein